MRLGFFTFTFCVINPSGRSLDGIPYSATWIGPSINREDFDYHNRLYVGTIDEELDSPDGCHDAQCHLYDIRPHHTELIINFMTGKFNGPHNEFLKES